MTRRLVMGNAIAGGQETRPPAWLRLPCSKLAVAGISCSRAFSLSPDIISAQRRARRDGMAIDDVVGAKIPLAKWLDSRDYLTSGVTMLILLLLRFI